MATRILGIDVSHHNGRIDWDQVPRDVEFVICKATEGTRFVDPTYADNAVNAAASHRGVGAYHFARPALSNPDRQAAHFLATVTALGLPHEQLLALDLEDSGRLTPPDLGRWAHRWLEIVTARLRRPVLYLPDYFAGQVGERDALRGWPLWLADVHGGPTVPTPWPTWRLLQYNVGAPMVGVPSAAVDRNYFDGNRAEFRAMAYGVVELHRYGVVGHTYTLRSVASRFAPSTNPDAVEVMLRRIIAANPDLAGRTTLPGGYLLRVPR